MFAPEHAAYVAFGFVSLVLLLLPLPWHWRVRNTGESTWLAQFLHVAMLTLAISIRNATGALESRIRLLFAVDAMLTLLPLRRFARL